MTQRMISKKAERLYKRAMRSKNLDEFAKRLTALLLQVKADRVAEKDSK